MFEFGSSSPQKTSARKKRINSAGKPKRKSLVTKKPDKEIDLCQEDDDDMISKPSKSHESRNDRSSVPSMDDGFSFLELGGDISQMGPIPKKKNRQNGDQKNKATTNLNGGSTVSNKKKMNSVLQTGKESILVQSPPRPPARPVLQFKRAPSSDNNKKRKKPTKIQPLGGRPFDQNKKKNRNTYGSTNNSSRKTQTDGSISYRKNSQLSSPLRPGEWVSTNSSSSRENSKNRSNYRTSFERYSKEWRTPPSEDKQETISKYFGREQNFSTRTQSSPKFRRKKKSNETEVIEIESSSDEEQSDAESDTGENVNNTMSSQKMECAEEYLSSYPNSQTENSLDNFGEESSQQATGRPRVLSLAHIILGKKLMTHKCRVDIMLGPTPYLILEFEERQGDQHKSAKLTINFSEIVEGLKYFILNDTGEGDDTCQSSDSEDLDDPSDIPLSSCPESFIVFDVEYDDAHELNRFRNSYEPFPEQDQEDKRWIILEPRSTSRFLLLIDWLRSNKPNSLQKLKKSEAAVFIKKMNQKQTSSQSSPSESHRGSRKSARLSNKSLFKSEDGEPLSLIYPFSCPDENRLEACAKNLPKLNPLPADTTPPTSTAISTTSTKPQAEQQMRNHSVTICKEDLDRLSPGEYLNDSIIDLWMLWLLRHENVETSKVHVFSSHFYSTLENEGSEAVESWTSKKKIDIFEKKLIFIPVNAILHWSLCVVVNPGKMKEYRKIRRKLLYLKRGPFETDDAVIEIDKSEEEEQQLLNNEAPCILFLDSLKAHRMKKVAGNIRAWLNSEWNRLHGDEQNYFCPRSMKVIDPDIPYQYNGWDCGVFVCRYAYALYHQRNTPLRICDMFEHFDQAIKRSQYFAFGMDDIREFREQLQTLISRLATLYTQLKKDEKQKKAARKKKEI